MSSSDSFDDAKRSMLQSLQAGIDFSPKGSIDKPCLSCVDFINDQLADYVTTSSCSGRISVNRDEGTGKGVAWLLVEHGPVTAYAVREAVHRQAPLPKGYGAELSEIVEQIVDIPPPSTSTPSTSVSIDHALSNFKCEGFILHIRCRDLAAGRRLHSIALAAGFRESGLTISARRVMLAVRSTSFSLELPIARGMRLLLDDDLLNLVVSEANNRLHDNFARISRFLHAMKVAFKYPTLARTSVPRAGTAGNQTHMQGQERASPRRWGHCCVCVSAAEGGGLMCLGGQGTAAESSAPVSRRKLPALMLSSSLQDTPQSISVVPVDPAAADMTDSVHAAALPALWAAAPGVHLAVVSGGRRSPKEPLPPMRVLQWHKARSSASVPSEMQSQLHEVALVSSGAAPPARWGHVLLPLDECPDSGSGIHTSSCMPVRRLLMHGGRDVDRVFDDAYVASLYFVQNTNQPAAEAGAVDVAFTIHCHWQQVPKLPIGARCFHAAAPVWSSIEGGEQGGSVLCATLALHGGLCGLGTYPAQELSDFWGVSLRIHIPPNGISSSENESEKIKITQDLHCDVHAYVLCDEREARFGHCMTPVGAQTFLLSGGTMFNRAAVGATDRGGDAGEDNGALVYDIEEEEQRSTRDTIGKKGIDDDNVLDVSSAPLLVVHCIQKPGGLSSQRRFALEISRSSSSFEALSPSSMRAEDMRCHHSASAVSSSVASTGQMQTSVIFVGGGVQVLAFGPTFCSTVKINLSCKDQEVDVLVREELAGAVLCEYLPQEQAQQQAGSVPRTGGSAAPLSGKLPASEALPVLVVPSSKAKRVKTFLEHHKWINKSRRMEPLLGSVALLAADMYAGDITSAEEIESASAALTSSPSLAANSEDNAQFVQLNWLGLSSEQYESLAVLPADALDPLAKKQTRREKDTTKLKSALSESKIGQGQEKANKSKSVAAGQSKERESFMAVPVESAFLRWLSSRGQGSAAGSADTQTLIATDLAQRLGCAFVPMFCLLPSMRVHTSTAPVKPEERASEMLCKLVRKEEFAGHFPDPAAACSMGGVAIPRKWELVGDVLMLPEGALTGHGWEHVFPAPPAPSYSSEDVSAATEMSPKTEQAWIGAKNAESIWRQIAVCFGPNIRRVARRAKVDSGPRRESHILLLYPAVGRPPLPLPIDNTVLLSSSTKMHAHQFVSYANTQEASQTQMQRLSSEHGETLLDVLPRSPGWVTVTENSIAFSFEMTRVMFCSGNVTERMRMARQVCRDEIIVDLYAGVGYYTIPFLVHGGAKHVHALEWNPFSVVALKYNLAHAGVDSSRYSVHEGDNRVTVVGESSQSPSFPSPGALTVAPPPPHVVLNASSVDRSTPANASDVGAAPHGTDPSPKASASLAGVAHRVCCGLLPSSAEGWPLAACVLNKVSGGIIHVHENVHEDILQNWAHVTLCTAFEALFHTLAQQAQSDGSTADAAPAYRMSVKCIHLEKVKSYAPRVMHIVADLRCVPVPL